MDWILRRQTLGELISIAFGIMILMLLMLPETRGRRLAEIGAVEDL